MAVDYSKTILFEGTPDVEVLKTENSKMSKSISILILTVVVLGTILTFNYIQNKKSVDKYK